ncbi:MAG: hypothetical protein LC779_16610, partial [Actinobacteria bacterium]|nr:hypothetical protein [Actinomycetota bacterium]
THGRVIWRDANHGDSALMQTKEWVTYRGRRTLMLDLRDAAVFEDDRGDRYRWGDHGRITALRWDPNEDPGRRRWHLWNVKLAADDEAYGDRFIVRWHDRAHRDGSVTRIYADPVRGGYDGRLIGTVNQRAGENAFAWRTGAVTPGRYWIHVETTTASGLSRGRAYATGPVVVR